MFTKSDKKNVPEKNEASKDNMVEGFSSANDIDRLFEQFLSNRWLSPFAWRMPEISEAATTGGVRVPSVDITETENELVLKAEIPGVNKEDIDISLSDNTATIKGKVHKENKVDKEEFHRREISNSSFSRTVTLPTQVDAKKTTAAFTNGILTITLPKMGETNQHSVKVE